ncbi:MAG: glycosyltransferase family 25 protein [Pyrinomonadaceae bacterium]
MPIFQRLHNYHSNRYVLTTRKNLERQNSLKSAFSGWQLEFFEGIDKGDTSKEQFESEGIYDETHARKSDRRSKAMTLGHICCSLGHKMIYEDMLLKGYERVMIFEDDAYPLLENESLIEEALDEFPTDAELIYWGWHGNEVRPFFSGAKQLLYNLQHFVGLEKYNHQMIKNLYPRPYNKSFARAGKHFCAHAYTLTKTGAERLIRWQTPITYNADNAIMYAILNGDLRGYVSHTKFFGQTSLERITQPLTA